MELKELFIKALTEETESTNALFDKETGSSLWSELRLDMILKVFEQAEKGF